MPRGFAERHHPDHGDVGCRAAALTGDLSALGNAIAAPIGDLVYLMNPIDLTRAFALAPGLGPIGNIIAAPALAAKTVIALDASDFIRGEGSGIHMQ